MRMIKCDRCGEEMPLFRDGNMLPGWRFMQISCVDGEGPDSVYDLCDKCMAEIYPMLLEKKKQAAPAAKKRIDKGKVGALADAGWTQEKIADEMGCSAQRVSQILQERKESYEDQS